MEDHHRYADLVNRRERAKATADVSTALRFAQHDNWRAPLVLAYLTEPWIAFAKSSG